MKRVGSCLTVLALLACLGGCLSFHAIGRQLANQSVSDLCSDDGFREHYHVFVDTQGRRPLLRVGVVENCSSRRRQKMLASLHDHLMVRLGSTGLFELLADVSTDNGSGAGYPAPPTEEAAADYVMLGRYREFRDGKRQARELSLQLIDLHNGKQIWSGISEIGQE